MDSGHGGGHMGSHSSGHVADHGSSGEHISQERDNLGSWGPSTDPNANPLKDPNSPLNPAHRWMRPGSRLGVRSGGASSSGVGSMRLLGISVLGALLLPIAAVVVLLVGHTGGAPTNGIRTTAQGNAVAYNGYGDDTDLGTLTLTGPTDVGWACINACGGGGRLYFTNSTASGGPRIVETQVQSGTGGGQFSLAAGTYQDVHVVGGGSQWSLTVSPVSGN